MKNQSVTPFNPLLMQTQLSFTAQAQSPLVTTLRTAGDETPQQRRDRLVNVIEMALAVIDDEDDDFE